MGTPVDAFNSHASITIDDANGVRKYVVTAPVRFKKAIFTVVGPERPAAWGLLDRITASSSSTITMTPAELREATAMGLVLAESDVAQPRAFPYPETDDPFASSSPTVEGDFARDGYAVIRDLLPPSLRAPMEQHCASLVREGCMRYSEEDRRYFFHNESASVWVHHALTSLIQRVVSCPIKPSYAFLASYTDGAELERHTDRMQCEYTVSLSLGQTPYVARADAWPLNIERGDGGVARLRLGIGDGAIFRGRTLFHSRDRMANATAARSLFLHYVPSDFSGPLD